MVEEKLDEKEGEMEDREEEETPEFEPRLRVAAFAPALSLVPVEDSPVDDLLWEDIYDGDARPM